MGVDVTGLCIYHRNLELCHVTVLLEVLDFVVFFGNLVTFALTCFHMSVDSFECLTELRNTD